MRTINPYLNFPGTAEEAFNFYRSVFGGEFLRLNRFREMRNSEHLDEEAKDKIMHIALPIGNGNVLMATDAPTSLGFDHKPGNNYYLCINVDSREEADRLFTALAKGGTIEMPLSDTFWGAYYGSLSDQFDIGWMISYDKADSAFFIN